MPNPTDLDYIIDGYMPTPAPTEQELAEHAREAERARVRALRRESGTSSRRSGPLAEF